MSYKVYAGVQTDVDTWETKVCIDTIEKRLAAVETVSTQHAAALRRDLTRFDGIDEEMRLVLVGVQNLLDAQLSGNNREGMQKSKSDINNYLLKGVTNHGSNV